MGALEQLKDALSRRIVVVDGAMGTAIQSHRLTESDYRGDEYRNHARDLAGCNDLLSITRPDVITQIHQSFLDAGADIIETNSFSASSISLADYGLAERAREINLAAARVARSAADQATEKDPSRPRFVAGSIGPTNKTASLSPDVADAGRRAVTFDDLADSYYEQASALVEGGVDLLLPETSFDTLNVKAALYAIARLFDEGGRRVPVICSMTITDRSGRTLSGQTVEAFYNSIAHADLLAVGINCALGATEMRPFVEELSRLAPIYTSCVPNAGLPNELGGYDEPPELTASVLGEFAERGWLNIVGGCCGTRPEHIAAIAEAVAGMPPRTPPVRPPHTRLSGLEPLTIRTEANFIVIGERTNVAGSRKFRRLIAAEKYEEALDVARKQVEGGANVLDVCMDDAMIDGESAMTRFLNFVATEPEIARLPVMIDSSKFTVIEAGLKCLQGKGIVNSISLKAGEEEFERQARTIRRYGAAVLVMAFDEEGQATDVERRVAIARRVYAILTDKVGFPPEDIIFDPNVLTVGTGIEEHADYAVSFIEATRRIKELFPLCKVSGGISNVSFAFRGNNAVREAMHAAFLYHAIRAGLDMGIVNAGQLAVYEEIPDDLRTRVEDVLLDRNADATERLTDLAATYRTESVTKERKLAWRTEPLETRLSYALSQGTHEFLEADIAEALASYPSALAIIEGPLMDGMNRVGELFGAGKMFLPQVVKSARVMRKAVDLLEPHLDSNDAEAASSANKGTVLIATVKGDVHDIGKNITAVVLRCNGYRVIDLGVMVPTERILDAARRERADFVGLSGLITPSLEEMIHVAAEMKRLEMTTPLLIGGATTSAKHTAVKIAPAYDHATVHVRDASLAVGVVGQLMSKDRREGFERANAEKQTRLREQYESTRSTRPLLPLAEARARKPTIEWRAADLAAPPFFGVREVKAEIDELEPWIDWSPFFHVWEIKGVYPALLDDPKSGDRAREVYADGRAMLERIISERTLSARGVYGYFPAASSGDDLVLYTDETRRAERARLYLVRQQRDKHPCLCLADFVAPRSTSLSDSVGAFAVTTGTQVPELVAELERKSDDYGAIMVKALADRLAEAFATMLHARVRSECGYGEELTPDELVRERHRGIRPAFGYPSCPDHSEKLTLWALLEPDRRAGIALTESMAMMPAASVSGIYLAHPAAKYFSVGKLGRDQIEDYARRKGIGRERAERWLSAHLGY